MATHASENSTLANDRTEFRGGAKVIGVGAVLAVGGIGGCVGLGYAGTFTLRAFLFGYLAAYAFVMTLALGCLSFVLLQHLTRAAWSVSVRRTAENFAATIPVLAVLIIPIIVSIGMLNGYLYRWALPMSRASHAAMDAASRGEAEMETGPAAEHTPPKKGASPVPVNAHEEAAAAAPASLAPTDPTALSLDPLTLMKREFGLHWLNPAFLIGRVIFYLAIWSGIALWYRARSIQQDRTSDASITLRMQAGAAPCLVILGLTITGFSFDLLMSLDPHWYSTMFGVYYIAECFLGSYSLLIITCYLLQRAGYLRQSITTEHFHDLGKYLFAFTFFFGYIAFSQYMLMWYANIPEETGWFVRHGASTFLPNGWSKVIIAILFGHILIPFAGLMSRFSKRRPGILVLWALWQFCFVAIDMYWVVLPEMGSTDVNYYGPLPQTMLIALAGMVGFLGVLFAAFGFFSSRGALRPLHDPRLSDSLVFQNI